MEHVLDLLINIIDQSGLFGVFLGIFAESIFPPIPSEIILGYAGFLVGAGKQTFFWVLIVSIAGKLASSAPIWWLGRKYGETFIQNYGKYIGYTTMDYNKAKKVFQKYGYSSVLISQFIPLVRSLISIPAGSLGLKFTPFIITTAIGAGIWNTFLIIIGTKLGQNWSKIDSLLNPYLTPIKYIVVFIILLFIIIQGYKIYKIYTKKS